MRAGVTAAGAPQSPCIGACRLDAQDVCTGCGRTIEEIVEWPTAGDERKHEIAAAARRRLPGERKG
ncbi:MAG: DUF1289 domain-containing protein [Gammaproteobacteria bacterium]